MICYAAVLDQIKDEWEVVVDPDVSGADIRRKDRFS